ncbi:MAG: DMT family transporter [Nonlabens sp.]
MIWLLLSIATSSLLYVIFKGFAIYEVNRLHAIVINYLVACATGFIAFRGTIDLTESLESSWILTAAVLGILFIAIFNCMALTSQQNGLSVAAVASKMSLVIPVVAGVLLYDESLGWLKIAGIGLAIIAVYLTSTPTGSPNSSGQASLLYPILVFVGSGVIDSLIKYAQQFQVPNSKEPLFSAFCFLFAFLVGCLIMIYEFIKGRTLSWKSVFAGIVLGIPNYFSIYFLILALKGDIDSSSIFPINHVGTVLITTAIGILLFREKLSRKNYLGVAIAVAGILLISLTLSN